MKRSAPGSLKAQYGRQLGLALALNLASFFVVARALPIGELGPRGLWTAGGGVGWMAGAALLTTVLNGLLSASAKARIVFLRWRDALPGHRAFTEHGPRDPRVDMARVEALLRVVPQDPAAQNRAWYSLLKAYEGDAAVADAHKAFLFTRDYAALSLLALMILAPICLAVSRGSVPAWFFAGALVLQFVVVRRSAATYGIRFAGTVLARASVAKPIEPKRRGKANTGSAASPSPPAD